MLKRLLFLTTVLICETFSQSDYYPPDYGPNLCENTDVPFNFIVAGAGSAGIPLAVRLSEEKSWNVLLLERGIDQFSNLTEIPLSWIDTLKSPLDYDYKSELDDKLYKGLDGQMCSIPRGKASGGSSTVNAQIFLRGLKKNFDDWKNLGCEGWDYESVQKYFIKLEDYRGEGHDSNVHHVGGPITVSSLFSSDPAIPILKKAFAETKLSHVDDFNAPDNHVGYGFLESNIRDGRRCGTFKGYLPMAKCRTNFFYARNVLVRRVLFQPNTKKAIGVEITAPNGKVCVINASNEVILSLGVIATPQILMLSGIGPKYHLESMGIPVIADLPVGLNYHDHASYPGVIITDRINRTPEEIKKDSLEIGKNIGELIDKNLPTLGLSKLMAFVNTGDDQSPFPDVQLIMTRIPYQSIDHTVNKKNVLYNLFGISENTASLFSDWNNKTDTIIMMVILTQVSSRGYIELRSTNPEHYPKIYPKLLSDQQDVDTLLRGIKYVQNLSKTKAFVEAGLKMEFINYENCQHYGKESDDYWICAFYQIVTGFFHPVGTARMGAEDDNQAVLNPRLKVKQVENLRVVDASSMPKCVSVNPNASVIMMAEKAADIIKQDYNKI